MSNINNIMSEEEIYRELIMPVDTDIQLSSVILSSDNKDMINTFIEETNFRDKLLKYGLQPMNRLLFYGDSGCGKTYLGKALSNHLGYKMLYVDIASSLSQGKVAVNLANIFRLANSIGEAIIFLDECDSIAWSRDSKDAEGGDIRRATNSLFQLLDQMNPKVIVVCATNMLHRLDPAFERRFNMKMRFKRPETNLRVVIKKFLHEDFKLINDRTDDLLERRSKLSFYELQGVAERCMKKSIIRGTTNIFMSDIYMDMANAMGVKTAFHTTTDEFYK